MEKIRFELTQDECSVIMKVITDYIEAATKRDKKLKHGISLEIGDVLRYLQYEELESLFHVITKFGGDDYSEEKILDWYIENRD